jgi:hypothetical protein
MDWATLFERAPDRTVEDVRATLAEHRERADSGSGDGDGDG